MNYGQFMMDHGKKSLEITNAIDVILKDVNKDRDEYNKIKFFVFGIDELNALHSLYDKNLDPVRNQVNLIGSLEQMFSESTYLPLPLLNEEK
ncbi:unnamed protein product [Rhizophagus irregularis]|nr:hypothetical protein RhiirB3_443672 [Rhizophagus irregularis]CAB4479544.1 unnamed protein product [Rhizophagus irregularis]